MHENGIIKSLGITTYYSPSTAANILSYSLLQNTHNCTCNPSTDTFIAQPNFIGPTPIHVQGITKNRLRVNENGIIKSLGITTYYSPSTAANILSYSLLKTTRNCTYNPSTETFIAQPNFIGPTLKFFNIDGHYALDTSIATSIFLSQILQNNKYNNNELKRAKLAHDFILKLEFVSYKDRKSVV